MDNTRAQLLARSQDIDQWKHRVVLCMPIWDSVKPGCVADLLKLVGTSGAASYVVVAGTLLPYSRNDGIRIAYQEVPNFTHIWFVDGDMDRLDASIMHRLLSHNVPVVGATAVRRRYPFKPACCPVAEHTTWPLLNILDRQDGALIECLHVGTGAMLIRRDVLEATKEETVDGDVWFHMDRAPRLTIEDEFKTLVDEQLKREWPDDAKPDDIARQIMLKGFELGLDSRRGTCLLGEDVSFCRRVQAAGFKVYVDTGCKVGHVGDTSFDIGHYMDWAHGRIAEERQYAAVEELVNASHRIITPELPKGLICEN